ncbi:MAG: hypothetical protein SV377_06970 [Halobacteria archaeon]|nr:hypothetical protein [Halobacteria archaeon]
MVKEQTTKTSSIGIELPYEFGFKARSALLVGLYLAFNGLMFLTIGAVTVYASEALSSVSAGATVFVWVLGLTVAVASFSITRRRFLKMVENIEVNRANQSSKKDIILSNVEEDVRPGMSNLFDIFGEKSVAHILNEHEKDPDGLTREDLSEIKQKLDMIEGKNETEE